MARFLRPLADRRSDQLLREVEVLREAVRAIRGARPFVIDAWVVLPDHLHCIWTLPAGDGTRWGAIKARFTRGVRSSVETEATRRPGKREQAIWQRRFWERHLQNEEEFAAAVRYCHINPVKHGFVARPQVWAWSPVRCEIAAGSWMWP